jgi:hypothetical protein
VGRAIAIAIPIGLERASEIAIADLDRRRDRSTSDDPLAVHGSVRSRALP